MHLLQRWNILVREPRAEHVFVPQAEATATRPRDRQGHLTDKAVLDPARRRAAAHEPWAPRARAPPAPPPTSHRRRLRTRRPQPWYLTPLLRKPRNALPGSPGALTEGAVLLPNAGARPRRPRSSEKPRTGTVMAADPRLPDWGSTSRDSSPRGWRPGSALTRPGRAASSAAQPGSGRHAEWGKERFPGPGTELTECRVRRGRGQDPSPGLSEDVEACSVAWRLGPAPSQHIAGIPIATAQRRPPNYHFRQHAPLSTKPEILPNSLRDYVELDLKQERSNRFIVSHFLCEIPWKLEKRTKVCGEGAKPG